MTLGAGTRLGPYEIQSAVGAGGTGEVYRARDMRLDRDVAIKVLPALSSADPERLGRFEQAETINGRLYRFEDKLAWVAYFNAGVRLVDLSDPYNPREVGYYVPKPNEKGHPVAKGQGVAIQMNDVDLDDRGLAYATDRTGAGLFILQRTDSTARSGT